MSIATLAITNALGVTGPPAKQDVHVMPEEQERPRDVEVRNPGHRFGVGHPRYGGRRRRSAAQARALAEEMGVDPLEFMLSIIKSDTIEQTVIENGKKKRVTVVVPLDVRLDAAKHVSRFCYPMLQATQITGHDEGPVEVVGVAVDLAKILADPDAARAAAALAMKLMEGNESPQIGPAPEEDVLLLESKDSAGHWKE